MIYTDMTRKAIKLAFKAHEGQMDKSGLPYVLHPVHVAEQMDDEYSTCVALLHDVVEDTDYTINDLKNEGFPKEVIDAVAAITKPREMSYEDYIKIVKKNPLATKVKLADIQHNSDLTRVVKVSEEDIRRNEKYDRAKKYLLE